MATRSARPKILKLWSDLKTILALPGQSPVPLDPMNNGIWIRCLAVVATLAAAIGGYTWYWHHAAGIMRASIPKIIDAARDQGYVVTLSETRISGYPYRISISFKSAHVTPENSPQNWAVELVNLTGFVQPWNLAHAIFDPGREVNVHWGGKNYLGVADAAQLSLTFKDGQPRRISADVTELTVTEANEGSVFSTHRAQFHLERRDGNANDRAGYRLSVTAENAAVPKTLQSRLTHLAPRISNLHASGILLNNREPSISEFESGLKDWHLEISRFSIHWPPIEMSGAGHLSVDEKHRFQGSVRTKTRGYNTIVDSLETAGFLSARKAVATKTVLNLLRQSAKDGNSNRNLLPITVELQDGRLYLGPVKVMKIQPLW